MTAQTETGAQPRTPLSRDRVLRAAARLADEGGIEAVSMRKVGQELGVEAMSLYNHVANKADLLDGIVDIVMGEIDLSSGETEWKLAMRHRALAARSVMTRHPWAPRVIETRIKMTPPMLTYMDSTLGILLDGGISIDLAHHAMHALGSRVLGFTQELFDDSKEMDESPEVVAIMLQQMKQTYPNISALVAEITHDDETIVGNGCDDYVEFVFALDLILGGLERLQEST